jgi:hypothetical protein
MMLVRHGPVSHVVSSKPAIMHHDFPPCSLVYRNQHCCLHNLIFEIIARIAESNDTAARRYGHGTGEIW